MPAVWAFLTRIFSGPLKWILNWLLTRAMSALVDWYRREQERQERRREIEAALKAYETALQTGVNREERRRKVEDLLNGHARPTAE